MDACTEALVVRNVDSEKCANQELMHRSAVKSGVLVDVGCKFGDYVQAVVLQTGGWSTIVVVNRWRYDCIGMISDRQWLPKVYAGNCSLYDNSCDNSEVWMIL